MTNFTKLARWDADFYKSLSEDDCLICLTERQVYLVGQIIEQLTWVKTRWTGDASGLDFDAISGELESRISERMTCENLTIVLNTVNNLQRQIISMQQVINQTFNEVDGGTDIFIFNPNTSTVSDVYTPQQLYDLGVEPDNCDTLGKDAVYGAVSSLVRFINQTNIDFLERINQAGNFPDQLARVISAIPILGSLPVDEAFQWAQFIATELEDEYNATVDEALLQSVICDLFCIAVASDCHLDFNDVYNYFAAKVSPTLSNATTTFLNLVNFGLTGTFAGADYFYYFCYFQIVTVGMGQLFFGLSSINTYAYYTRAGLNSPDNDWSIFCIGCPTFYRIYTADFAQGLGDWILPSSEGVIDGNRIKGVDKGFEKAINIHMPALPAWRIRAVKVYTERVDGIAHGTGDEVTVYLRPTAGSNTGASQIINGGFLPNGVSSRCGQINTNPFYVTGFNEIGVHASVTDNATSNIWISKIEILYEVAHAKTGAIITEDGTLCS